MEISNAMGKHIKSMIHIYPYHALSSKKQRNRSTAWCLYAFWFNNFIVWQTYESYNLQKSSADW